MEEIKYDPKLFPLGSMPIYNKLYEFPCHAKLSYLMNEVTIICLN